MATEEPDQAGGLAATSAGALREQARQLIGPGQLFIDGAWREPQSGNHRDILDPSTGAVVTSVAQADEHDLDQAIGAARRAFDDGPWPRMSPAGRATVLRRAGALLYERAEGFALRETIDVGKPITPTRQFDVPQAAELLLYHAGLAQSLNGAARPGISGHDFLYTRREPVGVVGAITPFNFPLNLSLNKVAPALAAGNTIVHKPAEDTPLSALLLAQLLTDAGLPNGVYNLVTGSGSVIGAGIAGSSGVDKIAFTGSVPVGITTQQVAAETLKRVTLELGGKNPLLVFPDADLEAVAETLFTAAFFNCGQFCMGCSRLIVHKAIHDELVERLDARINSAIIGDPFDPVTEVGPLAHRNQFDKVRQYVDIANEEGAILRIGGNPHSVPELGAGGYFHDLTVFTGVTPQMRLAQEEVFGPVLAVIRVDDEADAIKVANALPFGLSAGIATADLGRAHRVAAQLQAGIIWLNTWSRFTADSPFGGYKMSGYGRELGPEGIDEYLQYKTVYVAVDI